MKAAQIQLKNFGDEEKQILDARQQKAKDQAGHFYHVNPDAWPSMSDLIHKG